MCAIKFDANKANLLCLFACLCLFYHFIFKYNELKARWLNLIQITFCLNVSWSAVLFMNWVSGFCHHFSGPPCWNWQVV